MSSNKTTFSNRKYQKKNCIHLSSYRNCSRTSARASVLVGQILGHKDKLRVSQLNVTDKKAVFSQALTQTIVG
jgi:hypothetical protein